MSGMSDTRFEYELTEYYSFNGAILQEGDRIVQAHGAGMTLFFPVDDETYHIKSHINSHLDEVILKDLTSSHQFWNCTCTCGVEKCMHIAACLLQKAKAPNPVVKKPKSTPIAMDSAYAILTGHINIDAERQKYTAIYDALREVIISCLKGNPIFKKLFNGFKLSGSYADRLKISKPDEFDLVVYFKLPEMNYVVISKDKIIRGNALINLTEVLKRLNEHNSRFMYEFLCSVVNDHGQLLENRFQHWMESLMSKVLQSIKYEITFQDQKFKLRYTKSGPAHTLIVHKENQDKPLFSVDFVPGFVISAAMYVSDNPPKYNWVAVPLPLKPATNRDNPSFSASYADEERKMMTDKLQFKNALRLMKKFRDRNPKMKHIKSYYIKTIFFWLDKEQRSEQFWMLPIAVIMREVFRRLEQDLRHGRIKHYWVKDKNLLGHLTNTQIKQMHNEVNLALKELCEPRLHSKILSIFMTKEEQDYLTRSERMLIADCFEAPFTAYSFELNALLSAFVFYMPIVCQLVFNLLKSK